MKAKILQIFPPYTETSSVEWASVAIGLSEGKLVGLPKGEYSVGDEVDLPPEFVGPEADGVLTFMTLELNRSGVFSVSEAPHLFGPDSSIAVTYTPSPEKDETTQAYLIKIFDLMRKLGDLRVSERGVGYSFNEASEWSAFDLLELGYLIADYEWKQRHELSALKGSELTENQKFGLRLATNERRKKGSESRRLIREAADRLLFVDPSLMRNQSELARLIKAEINTSEWVEENGGLNWSLAHIRRILRGFFPTRRV